MSREIKFRAWDKGDKVMIPHKDIYRIHMDENKGAYGLTLDSNICGGLSMSFDLMQFTGLLDKNGKEIYEGDVVKTKNGTYAAEWDDQGSYIFKTGKHDDYYVRMVLNPDQEAEVIGNIYENPELLNA